MSFLQRELELNGLEAPGELQLNILMQHSGKPYPEKPKLTWQKPGHYQAQCRQLRREENQIEGNKNSAGKNIDFENNNKLIGIDDDNSFKKSGQQKSNCNNKNANICNANNTNIRNDRKPRN